MKQPRNTDGLKENAAKKRQKTFERANKAIDELVKQNKEINFSTVAKAANVSKAWLYKEPEINKRILSLRERTDIKPLQSDSELQRAYQLLQLYTDRIAELEAENVKLRQQVLGLERHLVGQQPMQTNPAWANFSPKVQQYLQVIFEYVRQNPGLTSYKIADAIAPELGLKPASVKAYLVKMGKAGILKSDYYMGPVGVIFNAWFVPAQPLS